MLNIDVSESQDLIYAGDIFRSVCLIQYINERCEMKELARDYNPRYVTALKAINPRVKTEVSEEQSSIDADTEIFSKKIRLLAVRFFFDKLHLCSYG